MSKRIKEKKLKEQSTVVSKYFSPENKQMDESLSEFKTPKKKVSAKSTDKAVKSKKPAAKATKKKAVKSKGQKDIRVALKSQVNELESDSTDFTNICSENRVDVDPEHLQLAIALSRSLHEFQSGSSQDNPNSGESSAGSSSQNFDDLSQTSRVRKALEKYGFIFPTSNTDRIKNQDVSKRKPATRRRKKSYILMKITSQEREEKVSDKISKVLHSTMNDLSKETSNGHNITVQCENVFQCSKSITKQDTFSYIDVLQNDREFYTNDIVEESKIKVGCLLRDWSAIPGREKSPERQINISNRPFQEYISNQEDLDILLSGIIEKCIFNVDDCIGENMNHSLMELNDSPTLEKSLNCIERTDHVEYKLDITASGFIKPVNQKESFDFPKPKDFRSYSPDIFDDDESDVSRNETSLPECHNEEMPEVNINQCLTNNEFAPMSFQKNMFCEVTQRRSNDFMDLTECIPGGNKIICVDKVSVDLTTVEEMENCEKVNIDEANNLLSRVIFENVDLTQSSGETQSSLENQEKANTEITPNIGIDIVENFDLTQSSGESQNPLENQGKGNRKTTPNNQIDIVDNFDLTQSSGDSLNLSIGNNSRDDLEKKCNLGENSGNQEIQNESLFDKEKAVENLDLTQCSDNSSIGNHTNNYLENNENEQHSKSFDDESIDLTQSNHPLLHSGENSTTSIKEVSLIYDPIDDPNDITDSTQSYNEEIQFVNIEQSNIHITSVSNGVEISNKSIDLSQSSIGDDQNILQERFESEKPLLGSKVESLSFEDYLAEHSIDYHTCRSLEGNSYIHDNPEKYDQSLNSNTIEAEKSDQNDRIHSSSKNNSTEKQSNEEKESSFSSQNSNCDVFDISDEELDYSMQHYKDEGRKSINTDSMNVINSVQKSKIFNFDIGGSSIFDGMSICSDRNSLNTNHELGIVNAKNNYSVECKSPSVSDRHGVTDSSLFLPDVKLGGIESMNRVERFSDTEYKNNIFSENYKIAIAKEQDDKFSDFGTGKNFSTPKSNILNVVSNVTPCNNQYMVKMAQITPMMDYKNMSSPDRNSELEKYGIKPFKRKRAVQLLEHIYYQTHPTIEGNEELADSVCRSLKRRRLSESAANNSRIELVRSPVSSQHHHYEFTDEINKKNDLERTKCRTNKKIARRSFQKSISENNFGNKPTTKIGDADLEIRNDMMLGDFLADNSINIQRNKEIPIRRKFTPKKNENKGFPEAISNETKPKSTNLIIDNLEVENDNLFDDLIFGNKPNIANGKLGIFPRKTKTKNTINSQEAIENVDILSEDSISQKEIPQNIENDVMYPVTNLKPVLKEINCESSDWVFQKREKSKVWGCRVPLHIAFHNYVSARPTLLAAILRYEPINIDGVHKGLLEDGYRYDAKDILRFMDKKCITVKTSDNDARNANNQKKSKPTLSQKSKR